MLHGFEIRVKGKVQGVWFRRSTQLKAQEFNLHGNVQNENDGSVLIRAFGQESDLDQLIKWCYEGPTHAHVEKVEFVEIPYQEEIIGFEILR